MNILEIKKMSDMSLFYSLERDLVSCPKITLPHYMIIKSAFYFNYVQEVSKPLFKTQSRLSIECGVSVRTIHNVLKSLEEWQIIKVIRQERKTSLKIFLDWSKLNAYVLENKAYLPNDFDDLNYLEHMKIIEDNKRVMGQIRSENNSEQFGNIFHLDRQNLPISSENFSSLDGKSCRQDLDIDLNRELKIQERELLSRKSKKLILENNMAYDDFSFVIHLLSTVDELKRMGLKRDIHNPITRTEWIALNDELTGFVSKVSQQTGKTYTDSKLECLFLKLVWGRYDEFRMKSPNRIITYFDLLKFEGHELTDLIRSLSPISDFKAAGFDEGEVINPFTGKVIY